MIDEIISMILALIGIVLVIALTYFASKWYAKRMSPIAGGKYIRVIDRLALTKASSIYIIEIQGIQYMLGVSEQSIRILEQLNEPIQFDKPEKETKNLVNVFHTFLHKDKDNGYNDQR